MIFGVALALMLSVSAAPVFGADGQGSDSGNPLPVSALGVSQVGWETVFVHVLVEMPPGADAN